MCTDGKGTIGTDERLFWDAMAGEIPDLTHRESIIFEVEPPPLLVVMDMIEFC